MRFSVHVFEARVVAAIKKLPSGSRRAQIRCEGHYLSSSFVLRKDAEVWARRMESEIDQGKTPAAKRVEGINNPSDLIDLHIDDMKSMGRGLDRYSRPALFAAGEDDRRQGAGARRQVLKRHSWFALRDIDHAFLSRLAGLFRAGSAPGRETSRRAGQLRR